MVRIQRGPSHTQAYGYDEIEQVRALAAHVVGPVPQLPFLRFLLTALPLAAALRAPRRRRLRSPTALGAADRVVALDESLSKVGHRERRKRAPAVTTAGSVSAERASIGRERSRRVRTRVTTVGKWAEQLGVVPFDPFGVKAFGLAQLRVHVPVADKRRTTSAQANNELTRVRESPAYTTSPRSFPLRGFFIKYSASSRVSLVS